MTPTDTSVFDRRRQLFADAIGKGALALVPAARLTVRNSDVEHDFRQDSDFFFLTGFDEPDAVALLDPGHATERFVLFVRPRDREREMWDGPRAGVEGAREVHGADQAYPLAELEPKLREHMLGRSSLVYRLGNPALDATVVRLLDGARRPRQRGRSTPVRIDDPGPALDEIRLAKSPGELAHQRRACILSAEAHAEAMRFARPGLHEYQVQAALEAHCRLGGSPRNGYGSIVASGANACVLHYHRNDRRIEDGDLVLIDAGCEVGYHTADITRTFPANGRFRPAQRRVYAIVLAAQEAAIAAIRPGVPYETIHHTARRVLTEGLIDLGLLPKGLDDSLAMHHYKELYPHGTGHWLGMDVHDVGAYGTGGRSRPLAPGMVLTVEPGLYFAPDREEIAYPLLAYDEEERIDRRFRLGVEAARKLEDEERAGAGKVMVKVPPEYRGIGIRIEDDILVTAGGHEDLTAGAPKRIDDVERTCAEMPRLAEVLARAGTAGA